MPCKAQKVKKNHGGIIIPLFYTITWTKKYFLLISCLNIKTGGQDEES